MIEWYVRFIPKDEEERLVVLPSRWRLLLWLLVNLWRCRYLTFFASDFYDDYSEVRLQTPTLFKIR